MMQEKKFQVLIQYIVDQEFDHDYSEIFLFKKKINLRHVMYVYVQYIYIV